MNTNNEKCPTCGSTETQRQGTTAFCTQCGEVWNTTKQAWHELGDAWIEAYEETHTAATW